MQTIRLEMTHYQSDSSSGIEPSLSNMEGSKSMTAKTLLDAASPF